MRNIFYMAAFIISCCGVGTAAAQQSDFEERCAAPGVVNCVGFDNETSDIVRGQNLHPDGLGTYRAFLDTSVKASGNGSLRFDLPPPPHAGANIAGSWSPLNNRGLGQLFGENSTFYVQFRQRFSESMLNNTWNSSWKTVIFHMNQTTCGGVEITTANRYLTGLLSMYTGCGTPGMYSTLDGTQQTENPPLLLQQGDYNCQYSRENPSDCWYFPADEWVTFYYKITLGDWDRRNSLIELWIAREGSTTYEQVIRVPNMPMTCNSANCNGSGEGYNNVTFTPYMTGLSNNSGRAGVTSRMWFDDFIVSTQPIAAPGGGVADVPRPNPPKDLNAQ